MGLVRTSALTLLVAMIATFIASDAAAQPSPHVTSGITVPVSGVLTEVATFAGSFTIQRFTPNGNGIDAVGTISGTLTSATGDSRFVVTQAVVPLDLANSGTSAATGDIGILQLPPCEILHLELGPLDLDLLGLVVHLDRVVLDLSAQPGAGNLLGNLLCAVTGLLDGSGGALQQITGLLNQILGILG